MTESAGRTERLSDERLAQIIADMSGQMKRQVIVSLSTCVHGTLKEAGAADHVLSALLELQSRRSSPAGTGGEEKNGTHTPDDRSVGPEPTGVVDKLRKELADLAEKVKGAGKAGYFVNWTPAYRRAQQLLRETKVIVAPTKKRKSCEYSKESATNRLADLIDLNNPEISEALANFIAAYDRAPVGSAPLAEEGGSMPRDKT